jgi:hypothetical protein
MTKTRLTIVIKERNGDGEHMTKLGTKRFMQIISFQIRDSLKPYF